MQQTHEKQLREAIEAIRARNPKVFYFVACGGSQATLMPMTYIFDQESRIPSHVYNSREFICRNPKSLDQDAVVILCSHEGKTPETVEAAAFAGQKGALSIALTNVEGSPLWQNATHPLHYDWGEEFNHAESLYGILFRLVFGTLDTLSPDERYQRMCAAVMEKLDPCIRKNQEGFKQAGQDYAKQYRRDAGIYTMGSGLLYPEAYSAKSCLYMEMQWMHASDIHSGEFFHGPFEVTDDDVTFLLLKSIRETRIMDDRAEAFLRKFTPKLVIIDAAEYEYCGVDSDLQKYFSQVITNYVVRVFFHALAKARGHMVSVRRYMWQFPY